MRATVDAQEFFQALNKVIKVLKPSSIPVMEGVLVQIEKDFLDELYSLKKLLRSTDKAHIYFSGGRLSLTAASGNYSTQVRIEGTSSIHFGFELRHMIDALQQFRGEPFVKMKVNSSLAPVVLEAEGRGDFAMVLPLRTKAAAA